jgi:hypothetical protein
MIVIHELVDRLPPGSLAEEDHTTQALFLETPQKSLHVRVQIWRLRHRFDPMFLEDVADGGV